MKKLLTMFLCFVVGIGSINAEALYTSGTFSNGGTWKINTNGVLIINASEVPTFIPKYHLQDRGSTAPWQAYDGVIKEIWISGANKIGRGAFLELHNAQRVSIAGVTSVEIMKGAFKDCSSLTSVDGFQYMTKIGERAFEGCPLKYVVLPKVTSLGKDVFGSNDESNASADVGYAKYTVMLTTSSAPTFEDIDFLLCDRAARLIVPASLKSQVDALWNAEFHKNGVKQHQMQEICVGGLLNQNNPRNFWMLQDDGTLWVVGAMPDFANASDAPWYSLRNQVKSVVIEGASSISNNAFRG